MAGTAAEGTRLNPLQVNRESQGSLTSFNEVCGSFNGIGPQENSISGEIDSHGFGKPPVLRTESEDGFSEKEDTYELDHRKVLRELIIRGDIDAAFSKLREWYPQVVQDDTSDICFVLHWQKWLRLHLNGDRVTANNYKVDKLRKYDNITCFTEMIVDVLSFVIDVRDPLQLPNRYLIHTDQPAVVADAVDFVILQTDPKMRGRQQNFEVSMLRTRMRQLLGGEVVVEESPASMDELRQARGPADILRILEAWGGTFRSRGRKSHGEKRLNGGK